MPNERTPLIPTLSFGPVRRRQEQQTCKRFFTIATTCLILYGVFIFAFHLIAWPFHYHNPENDGRYSWPHKYGRNLSHQQLRKIFMDTPTASSARESSQYYASGAHLAGKNFSQADWTREKWQSWGIQASIAEYEVYLNYPVDHSLSMLEETQKDQWKVSFKASLKEDALKEDPTTNSKDSIPTFHGYSASGNVTGQFVYANYGSFQDYQDLVDAGVNLKGKIAIARYGGLFRGLKVKRAQELGMIGVLLYSDPGDDGLITEENGHEAYPAGPARNPSSVQRGSVSYLSNTVGDPTTPGYPSKPGVPRVPLTGSTPDIPSIPISYADALPILKALNGHGPEVTDFGKYWQKNLGLKYKGVNYNIGPSPANVVLNLYNEQEYVTTPLWDVIGVINGTIPNEVIVVGNHRDAWIVGGAGDPNSGSAVMNEVIRSVGVALDAGWRPLRTIVFGSWDGEEYGLIGSTEWVEEYLPWIKDANVAYVNVDVGASGPHFKASAAPLLHNILQEATKLVPSPNQTVPGQSIADVWDGKISTIGSGSDFTAFQDFAGVPCLDFGFNNDGAKGPVYHYHSNYDSFHWMNEYGDPGYLHHEAMAKLLGNVLLSLSEEIVIPFEAKTYGDSLLGYLDQVESALKHSLSANPNELPDDASAEAVVALRSGHKKGGKNGNKRELHAFQDGLKSLRHSLVQFSKAAARLDKDAAFLRQKLDEGYRWWNILGKIHFAWTLVRVNREYKNLERHFVFEDGLDNRTWFKHVVYAPGLWTGYAGAVYPGLVESIDAQDYTNGLRWTKIIKKCVEDGLKSLKGELNN